MTGLAGIKDMTGRLIRRLVMEDLLGGSYRRLQPDMLDWCSKHDRTNGRLDMKDLRPYFWTYPWNVMTHKRESK